jgi:cation transport regulator ChaC
MKCKFPSGDAADDTSIEIASGFRSARYRELRPLLDVTKPNGAAWEEIIGVFKRRLEERFEAPIAQLLGARASAGRPGFAILALDCLLIDTLQSFREGRVTTGDVSSASSFRAFLKSARFSDFNSDARSAFFDYVRNALLHNGETRGDWRVRANTSRMLSKSGSTRTINRSMFHAAVVEELGEYCDELTSGPEDNRRRFLRRMDAICGILPPPTTLYFAYGSNLMASNIEATAPGVEGEGVAFLPGYRLAFTKHSLKWRGDAASIEPSPTSVVWGYVYRLSPEQHASLVRREKGYDECSLTVWRVDGVPDCQDGRPITAVTFVGATTCARRCGPVTAYVDLLRRGASSRGLPERYVESVAKL